MRVKGKVAPVIEKAAPDTVAELTVTGAVPEAVSVSGWVEVVFKATLPKPRRELTLTLSADAVPDPVRFTVVGLPVDELLQMVMAPLAAPAAVGVKTTWRNVIDLPGDKVTGKDGELMENSAPLRETELIVSGSVPVDVTISGNLPYFPSTIVPKLRLDALSPIVACPRAAA